MSHHRTPSNQGNGKLKQEASRGSLSNKSTFAPGHKNFDKISKIDLDMFEEIEDGDERERLFFDTLERMKKAIEELHLKVFSVNKPVGSHECKKDSEAKRRQ